MSKTLGLVLGSGGARGVAHAGVLQALDEEGIKPEYITGCSMGAVVGGCYASGVKPAEMKDIFLSFKPKDLLDLSPALFSGMSFFSGDKIRNLLSEHLKSAKLEDMSVPFRCIAVEIISGKLHVFKRGSAVSAISASCSIPGIFRPVTIGSKMYIDGGCLCRLPLKEVKKMGADVVVAVDVLSTCSEECEGVHNIFSLIARTFGIIDAHQSKLLKIVEGSLCNLLIEPDLGNMNQYRIKDLDKAYMAGYCAGKRNIAAIKSLLES